MFKKILIGAGIVVTILLITEVVALLVMKSSVNRYAQYWKNRASQPADKQAFIYVALGDSTAQGIGATSANKGYVGLLADAIGRKTGRQVRVINLSKTGAKIDDVLNRQLPELKAASVKPDLITMEIGANNLLSYNAETFKAEYQAVLEQLPADRTVISDMPYFGGRINVHGADQQASDVIVQIAKQYNIPVAPLYETLKKHHSPRIYAADYFHPSNYGYTLWRNAFLTKIEPPIGPKQ